MSTGSTAPCGVLHTPRHFHDPSCGFFLEFDRGTSSNISGFDGRLRSSRSYRKAAHSVVPCSAAVAFHYPTPVHRRRYLPPPHPSSFFATTIDVSTRAYKQRFIIACAVSYPLKTSEELNKTVRFRNFPQPRLLYVVTKTPTWNVQTAFFLLHSTTHVSGTSTVTVILIVSNGHFDAKN